MSVLFYKNLCKEHISRIEVVTVFVESLSERAVQKLSVTLTTAVTVWCHGKSQSQVCPHLPFLLFLTT